MLAGYLAFISASSGVLSAGPQKPSAAMLAAAFVRFKEPHDANKGERSINVEAYPICVYADGRWREATIRDARGRDGWIKPGSSLTIYDRGAKAGWMDINRVEKRRYLGEDKWVGLGGWSLPRSLYPYRLVRSSGRHFLARGVYSWEENGYHLSVQPFLAMIPEAPQRSRTEFLASMVGESREVLTDWLVEKRKSYIEEAAGRPIVLQSIRLADLDDDRVPEAIASYKVPSRGNDQQTLVVIATIHAQRVLPRFEEVMAGEAHALDVLDIDSDGWQEVVLTIRGDRYLTFSVLQSRRGDYRRVFTGAGFAKR